MRVEGFDSVCYGTVYAGEFVRDGYSTTVLRSVKYAITEISEEPNNGYQLKVVCYHESLPEDEQAAGNSRKKKKEQVSYLGDTGEMHICINPETAEYDWNLGQLRFLGNDTDLNLSINKGLTTEEIIQARESSVFDGTILYPTKYLGKWFADYESIIILVLAVFVVLAIIFGDWMSVLLIPLATYLSFYTSWMVCLPVMPFIILSPLSYIPRVPNGIAMLANGGVFIGLCLLYSIYQGSTFWNTIVMAITWLMGCGVFTCVYFGCIYDDKARCPHCGRRMHHVRDAGSNLSSAMSPALTYTPLEGSSGVKLTMPAAMLKKSENTICLNCKF